MVDCVDAINCCITIDGQPFKNDKSRTQRGSCHHHGTNYAVTALFSRGVSRQNSLLDLVGNLLQMVELPAIGADAHR